MAPLVVQLVAWAALWLAGVTGLLPAADTPVGALRVALAVMFGFTALSHFLPRTRPDLVRMVPPAFPAPGFLVSLTGVLELAGAIGLVLPPLTRAAALALAALLVALFPANIRAARAGLPVAGRPAMPLRLRLPLQLFWIACLLWVAAMHPPAERSRPGATRRGAAADERAGVAILQPPATIPVGWPGDSPVADRDRAPSSADIGTLSAAVERGLDGSRGTSPDADVRAEHLPRHTHTEV